MALIKNQQSQEATELFVPSNAVFKGDINMDGNARIEGVVEGNVNVGAGNVLLGVKSRVGGDINGGNITIGGVVTGNLTSQGQIGILSGAKVKGDIEAAALEIEMGSEYQGAVCITNRASEKKQLPQAQGGSPLKP